MTEPVASERREPAREVIRGASDVVLERPAGVVLGGLRWDGRPGHPDTLPAGAFLSRL